MNALKEILDKGCRLVIKKQSNGMIIALETEIDGKEYHTGIPFDTTEKLCRDWDKIVRDFLLLLYSEERRVLQKEVDGYCIKYRTSSMDFAGQLDKLYVKAKNVEKLSYNLVKADEVLLVLSKGITHISPCQFQKALTREQQELIQKER